MEQEDSNSHARLRFVASTLTVGHTSRLQEGFCYCFGLTTTHTHGYIDISAPNYCLKRLVSLEQEDSKCVLVKAIVSVACTPKACVLCVLRKDTRYL